MDNPSFTDELEILVLIPVPLLVDVLLLRGGVFYVGRLALSSPGVLALRSVLMTTKFDVINIDNRFNPRGWLDDPEGMGRRPRGDE